MPPTTARRRWTVVLAVQLAAALLATGAAAGSAADAGELVWLGEAGSQTEGRWTTDPSVRPWRDADGSPAAFQDGRPVVLDERAVNRAVVVADPDGVAPASVRFSHRTGRYTLDALGPGGVTGLTTLTVDGDGELEVRNANGYAGTTDLRRGLLSLGDDAALGHSTLLVGGGAVRALGDRRLANPVRFRHPDGPGPVTATIAGDHDLTVAGDVELNPEHPTSVAVDGAGVTRLLGAVHDPAGGPGRLVKLGDGVLELGGDGNRYSGGTIVAGGTLLGGAARGSATGSGPVTVRAAAHLGGAGTLSGAVTVERGGTVAPGAAPGHAATLATTGRLALHRGAVLDIAETTGLITPLTRYVLQAAVEQVGAWRDQGAVIGMSVNLSVRNLLESGLVDRVDRLLAGVGVPPGLLTLELTEGAVMTDPDATIAVLHQLSGAGVRLSIDDFGTGYSSLAYLKQLPVDEVKLDKAFVMGMTVDADDEAIVSSTIELAHNLGLRIVAEGVEDRETWDALAVLGCELAQGHYVAPPMAAEDATRWLWEHRAGEPTPEWPDRFTISATHRR